MSVLGSINSRNYSQKTNFMCGTPDLPLLPFYVTTLNIPGVNTNIPENSGRQGAAVHFAPADMSFNNLSLEVLLDEDYKIFQELINAIKIDVETGTFENHFFDFWIEVTNDMGHPVLKIEYHECLIETIGDLQLSSNDDITEQTFTLDIKFDWFKIIPVKREDIPELKI